MRSLRLIALFLTVSSTTFSQNLNIQSVAEDKFFEGIQPITNLEYGISGLTPLADKQGNNFLYVAANEGGLKIYETSPTLNLIQTLDTNVLSQKVSTLDQVGNLLYVGTGSIFGDSLDVVGLSILDISDPYNPVVLDTWLDPNSNNLIDSGAGVVRVKGDHCYIGGMAEGLVILDVSSPSAISFVSKYAPAIDFPTVANTQEKVNARGMALNDDLVYMCYDAGGVRVIDVSDVNNPNQIAEFANPITFQGLNWPRAYNNIVIDNDLAYVAVDYCGLEVWDISTPSTPQMITHWNPVGCPVQGLWWDAPIHTNEMVLQPECDMLFISTGKSELMVLDIGDPLAPVAIDSFGTVLDTAGSWGVDITDDHIYLTYVYVGDWVPQVLTPFYSNWNGVKQLSYDMCHVGISEDEMSGVGVYPNPVDDVLTISGVQGFLNYSLVDLHGKSILEGQEIEINVSEINAGMYFLKVNSAQGSTSVKVIIE